MPIHSTTIKDGKEVFVFKLENKKGTIVQLTNYGGIIMAYKIKMSDGSYNDIVLGFDDVKKYWSKSYLETYPFFGAAIGRYGNRIANGIFELNGKTITVSKNFGAHQLHGGFEGFDKKVWDVIIADEKNVVLQYTSKDGEEGFPGTLTTTLKFNLQDDDSLMYSYEATTDKATPVNLTHHSYFNLNNGEGDIKDHLVKIYSHDMLEQDAELTTTGKIIDVKNTRHDFTQWKKVNENLQDGFDQSFVLAKNTGMKLAAEVYSPSSKLLLQVHTTEPVVHFYTGQGVPDIEGKTAQYNNYSGLCLETQVHPGAVNHSNFPNTILQPGEKYFTETKYVVKETNL